VLAKVSALFWLVLVAIAFTETAAPHFSRIITRSQMNQIDKRNALTLIPLSASSAKVIIYILAFIFGLGAFGVDISPLLNMSTVAIAIFGFAGAETFKDILASLKIFIDRLYYVGSIVEVSTDGLCKYEGQLKGTITKITLFNTTIQLEKSATFSKSLTVANGAIRSIIVYQENIKSRE
jgi:small-conductance mechanosensitive channel